MRTHLSLFSGISFALTVACGPTKIPGSSSAQGQLPDLSFASAFTGSLSTQDANPVTTVRPGKVSIANDLRRRDGTELTPESLKTESQYLRLYVTDYEPQNPKEIEEKKVWWWQNWSPTVTFELPSSAANKKLRLFITLSKVNPKTNAETLIQTTPVDLFVDGKSTGIAWLSPAQFIPAAQNAEISLKAEIATQGAPLEGTPTAESTTDGTTWSAIAIEKWTPDTSKPNVYTFSVRYPFQDEKPFRVRLKAKDAIGNLAVSDYSPNLIGRADFLFAPATDSERASCKDSANAPASRLVVMAPSSVLCRARGATGEVTANRKLSLLIDNRGSAPFRLAPEASGLLGNLQYTLTSGDNHIRTTNITHPSLLTSDLLKAPLMYYWEMEISRITVSGEIKVTLDKNLAGKYSSSGTAAQSNTCYSAPGYPAVTIQNPTSHIVLQDSPFPCDE
jgi:hypothetical protein